MQRELKFRAWDKEDKRMITHEQDFIPLKVCSLGVLRLNPTTEQESWHLLPIERFEVMQYTGLKDKNGVEIYEGDVCKYINPYNKESYTRDVRYCPMFACFGLYKKDGSIYEYESDWLKIVEVEVIGNIHEQEYLLNEN